MNNRMNKIILLLAALLAACTPMQARRGNMLEDYQVAQIIPTIHTRSDVLRLWGSPTTQAPFNDNVWYYLGQDTEKRGILDAKVMKERIVVVAFDETGVVSHIEDLPPGRIDVAVARTKTATHGNDITFMQQLLGNLGKFNKDQKSSPTDLGRQ